MANNKNYKGSLRLDWINKDLSLYYEIDEKQGKGVRPVWVPKNDIRVAEPRILRFVKSYGDPTSENMLIKGDNLLVLRSLVEIFKGKPDKEKVKCIYIDPPFNSGNAFKYYDDNLQHSEWLTMMRDRLFLLKKLLRKDGVIFVHINNEEGDYLRILMDEIFGRDFFLTKISWQRAADTTVLGQGETPVNDVVEYILVYGSLASLRKIFRKSTEVLEKKSFQQYHQILKSIGTKKLLKEIEIGNNGETAKIYLHKNWEIENISLAKFDQRFEDIYKKYKDNFKKIIRLINPQKENSLQQRFLKEIERDNFYSVEYTPKKGKNRGKLIEVLYYKKNIVYFLKDFAVLEKNDIYKTFPMNNFWPLVDIPATGIAKEGGIEFKRSKKPEKLIKRILEIATEKDDIVLDSFAGSGTTGAVAHKMGRRWLMVEIGRQAEELIIPRLQGVIKGNDQTGVSKEVGWQGGGGFKYYKLGESVIHEQDMNWALKAEEMAEAVFLHFQYRPVKAEWLKKENMYLGRHQFARFHFALSFATREVKVLTEDLYEKIIAGLDKEKFKHLTIFTNVALAVPPESLDDRVLVKKIPAAILREYNLL